ncbi:hypothetical protein [Streptomyces huiliensis]|uniref:hypothetical protein n=1 Tax=Streptomyces huiliensis TaxID=2876027 RepID=UPI001CBFFB23|nr:hypothetical protein [Streptomyces huiliensis]MBZ4320748.1 hypothetical protein [Streptomyces huiliensis]
MIDVLLHHYRLVEFARDAADQRLLTEARIAGRANAGREARLEARLEAERRVRTQPLLPLIPRQRDAAGRAGL